VTDGPSPGRSAPDTRSHEAFKAAATRRHRRNAKTNLDHRVKGDSYKVEVFEDAIGLALERVAVSSTLRARTVAEASRPGADGGDVLARARITRERERAALRFAKGRDLGKLEATMARLDAEAEAAVARPSLVSTAAEAHAYPESLPAQWAKTSDAGRHAIAEAVLKPGARSGRSNEARSLAQTWVPSGHRRDHSHCRPDRHDRQVARSSKPTWSRAAVR
jgi:hypothetical protein